MRYGGRVTPLAALGWDEGWADAWVEAGKGEPRGRVVRVDRGWATLWTAAGESRVRTGPADVAPGDWVVAGSDGERVAVVLPRRGAFVRRAARGATVAHVVAANVDVAALLHGLTARLSPRRLERELVIAFDSGARPVVVLTKADVGKDIDSATAVAQSVAPDVTVVVVSAATGQGIDDVSALTGHGQTLALLGASGVGKSTLVNALLGRDAQRVGHVRSDQKGRHTTSAAELLNLPGGGVVVDTPGLRSLALWSDGEGLDRAFLDITERALDCRFPNCEHRSEPGCAVRGLVAPERIEAYRRLRAEQDQLTDEMTFRR